MLMFSNLFDSWDTQNQCDIVDRSITMLLFFCMKVGASFREHIFFKPGFVSSHQK